jgi:hypothetical protein
VNGAGNVPYRIIFNSKLSVLVSNFLRKFGIGPVITDFNLMLNSILTTVF